MNYFTCIEFACKPTINKCNKKMLLCALFKITPPPMQQLSFSVKYGGAVEVTSAREESSCITRCKTSTYCSELKVSNIQCQQHNTYLRELSDTMIAYK
jgi:hypothetical protein